MIISYRDRRTRAFARGERVPAFESIARRAQLKLDQLDAATSMADLFRVAGRRDRAGKRRDRRLSLKALMARDAIHPGEHLAEILAELDMSAAALARQLKVPTNRITGIINGQRAVTGDTALRLAHFFGGSPEFWLNLQKLYELRQAEAAAGPAIRRLPRLSSGSRREARRVAVNR